MTDVEGAERDGRRVDTDYHNSGGSVECGKSLVGWIVK